MLLDEARLMRQWIANIALHPGSICLNVGSSTREFREEVQPFIEREILAPLRARGCEIVNCDLKKEEGVDEEGDLLDPSFQQHLAAHRPHLVICSNLLEHLVDPVPFATACGAIVRPGGACLFTVPRSFPYHPDPLDTMFRPSPAEIANLLPAFEILDSAEIEAGSYRDDLGSGARAVGTLARQAIRALMPFYRPGRWYPAVHKLLWLFRPYKVSLVLLRRPDDALTETA